MIIEAVNAATKDRGRSRAEVVRDLRGVKKSVFYKLVAGKGNTSVDNLDEILAALHLAVAPIEHITNLPDLKRRGYKIPAGRARRR